MQYSYRPVVLVVLDGWGEWETKMGNPMSCAKMPTIDQLNQYYPKLLLEASGLAVGLPWGVFGNSEVGHQTLGSGQIIYHYLPTITAAIQSRRFFNNEILLKVFAKAKKRGSKLHIMGLLSDGGVHSHIDHAVALLQMAKEQGINEIYVHAITDGRDTPPQSSLRYIPYLLEQFKKIGIGRLATIVGRYYTMDRNRNWDRVERGFLAMVDGDGEQTSDPIKAIMRQHGENKTDEYLEPIVMVDENNGPAGLVGENDVIINFNFRADRARQISYAFADPGFDNFKHAKVPPHIYYVGFSEYSEDLKIPAIFPAQKITSRIGDILAKHHKKQLRIAETEKYAHVTYFFNGGMPDPFPGEDRIFVPSKNAPSYATVPEMSAAEINAKLIAAIKSNKYDFILVNYANTDMVGHTGDFRAGIKALEVVDGCLKELVETTLSMNGCLLITADHGNIEEMINLETGQIDTQHSTNPVPFWYVSPDSKTKDPHKEGLMEIHGMIADVSATILTLFNLKKPEQMIGNCLFDRLYPKKKDSDK